ncbi:MAG: DUF4097 family beta strand repeat-containing protein [Acidobacteriia bacterium]|nr:DUF4097 family beta strand repeat-containing protein [Terriglobia bacterium]
MPPLRNICLSAALLAMPLLLAGCATSALEQGTFERTLTVSGPVHLELANGAGSVEFRGGEPGKVYIHAEVRAGGFPFGNPRKRLDEILSRPPIEQSGDTIRIGKDSRTLRNITIRYVIETPAESEIQSRVGSGAQEVRNIRGPVELVTGSGAIRASRIAREAQFATGSGSIEASDLGDAVRATTGSGSITLAGVKGEVRAKTGSGSITLSAVEGRAQLHAASGNVTVRDAAADLEVHTASGGISIAGNPAPNSNWELHAVSSSVELSVPPDASFQFSARSVSGGIQTDIPIVIEEQSKHELRARLGSGAARVEVHTVSGSIRVRAKP